MKLLIKYVRLHRDRLNEHDEVDAIISGGKIVPLCNCPRVKIVLVCVIISFRLVIFVTLLKVMKLIIR